MQTSLLDFRVVLFLVYKHDKVIAKSVYFCLLSLKGQLDCGCLIDVTLMSVLMDGRSSPFAELPAVSSYCSHR